MTIILAIALLIGGGTSYVAQNSLPGDVLYSVKVNLNEEVQGFVAFGSEAKARLSAGLAERRLEEAEKLAVDGKLTTETRANIESRFEEHGKAFEEELKNIDSSESSTAILEINSNFEASLKANEQILVGVADKKESGRAEVESLLIKVRSRLSTTVKSRSDAEAKVSAGVGVDVKVAAEGKLKATENKISEVKDFIAKTKSASNVNASAKAETRIRVAEEAVVRGKAELEASSYGKAFASFEEAMRIAQEAKLLVTGGAKINLDINLGGVGVGSGGGTTTNSGDGTSSGASIKVESSTKINSGNSSSGVSGDGKLKVGIGL